MDLSLPGLCFPRFLRLPRSLIHGVGSLLSPVPFPGWLWTAPCAPPSPASPSWSRSSPAPSTPVQFGIHSFPSATAPPRSFSLRTGSAGSGPPGLQGSPAPVTEGCPGSALAPPFSAALVPRLRPPGSSRPLMTLWCPLSASRALCGCPLPLGPPTSRGCLGEGR